MKSKLYFLLLAAFAMTIMVSCSKDDETEPDNENNNTSGTLTCKVDGNSWSASLAVVASNEGGILTLTGSDSNSQQCFFSIHNATSTGTYNLGGSMTNQNMGRWTQGIGTNDTFTTMLGQGAGTVTITELTDTGFKGTFEFTAKNSSGTEVSITEGSFNATFD